MFPKDNVEGIAQQFSRVRMTSTMTAQKFPVKFGHICCIGSYPRGSMSELGQDFEVLLSIILESYDDVSRVTDNQPRLSLMAFIVTIRSSWAWRNRRADHTAM